MHSRCQFHLDFLRWLLQPALDSSTNLKPDNAHPFALAQLNTRLLLASIQSRLLQLTGGERSGSRRSLS